MTPPITEIWVYLSASPLLGLTLTLLAYQGAFWLYKRSGMHPLANPVLIAVAHLGAFTDVDRNHLRNLFRRRPVRALPARPGHGRAGGAAVHAVSPRARACCCRCSSALVAGSLTAALSAIAVARLFGASLPTQLSLAPKSVTTPIAMGIAERIGGMPSLTAVLVIVTGILGAVGARYVFDACAIRDPAIRGFAIGVASHGIGTARAFQVSEQAGAFAALAMGLNGALTALLLPLVLGWVR